MITTCNTPLLPLSCPNANVYPAPCKPRTGSHRVHFSDQPNPTKTPSRRAGTAPKYAALDSGATDNFMPTTYMGLNHSTTHPRVRVGCANGSTMESKARDELALPNLPPGARGCYKFDEVDLPLISVPKLCDTGCTVNFSATSVDVHGPNGQPILQGSRDPTSKLYMIPLDPQPTTCARTSLRHKVSTKNYHLPPQNSLPSTQPTHHGIPDAPAVAPRVVSPTLHAGNAYEQRTVPQLIHYLHAVAGFPTKATWIKAVEKGNFITWPGLTPERIRKYLGKSEHTVKGHMHMIRQGIRSTTKLCASPKPPSKHHHITPFVIDTNTLENDYTNVIAWDLPGRFPVKSTRGNQYLFIMYDHDANYIHAIPIKSRKTKDIVQAFQEGHEMFKRRGLNAKLIKMDNEVSKELTRYIERNNLDFQIVSPGDHRQNHAERAIQTFKNHFISILSGTDPKYPEKDWDLLLTQTIITVNLLRQSRMQPQLSAYAQVHGNFDFNKTPLAPAGCRVIVHERPQQRGTWADHGVDGYYTGPALKHYRNYVCLINDTETRRISNTVEFFPTSCPLPTSTPMDRMTMAIQDLKETINVPDNVLPGLHSNKELNASIRALQDMINETIPREPTPAKNVTIRKPRKAPRVNNTEKTRYSDQQRYQSYYSNSHNRPFPFLIPTPKTGGKKPKLTLQACSGSIWDDETKRMLAFRDLMKHSNPTTRNRWTKSGEDEFGRLFQGFEPNNIEGMDVLEWIRKDQIPPDKKVTYPRYTVAIRPEKADPYRTRITAGGDQLSYDGDVATQTAGMETVKTHWNSVISTPGAKYCTGDISNMYLCSTLDEPEYVRFRYDQIPPRIIEHYKLDTLVDNGFVYAKIKKAWYGLKQSGRIAHDDLVAHLKKHGYHKAKITPGLFIHETRPISFTLVVDDFGIKYIDKADAEHLIAAVREKYPFKVDWEGKQYIGIHLKWDYKERTVRVSMDGYVEQALKEFKHNIPKRHTRSPSIMERPDYGQKIQYVKLDDSKDISPRDIKFIQQVTGKFLFYARAIDNTMLHALNDIARAPNKESTYNATVHLLNYAASNPNAEIIYRASDMILAADSDAAYLVCPEAKSRAGGFHYLTNHDRTLFNGPILVLAKVIKNVMASAAEAEVAALYMNAQEALPIRQCLIELGHPQPATAMKTDNSTAKGILTGTIKQKRSKAIDMRFYWLKDRAEQGQFHIFWEPGTHNLADYPTKHHTGQHHKTVRPIYLYNPSTSPKSIQGCIEILNQERKQKVRRLTPGTTQNHKEYQTVVHQAPNSLNNRPSIISR